MQRRAGAATTVAAVVLVAVALGTAVARACDAGNRSTVAFTDLAGGLWEDASNWYCGLLPCPGDDVAIFAVSGLPQRPPVHCPAHPDTRGRPEQPANAFFDVIINTQVTVGSIVFGDGKEIVLDSGGIIDLGGADAADRAACVQSEVSAITASASPAPSSAAAATALPATPRSPSHTAASPSRAPTAAPSASSGSTPNSHVPTTSGAQSFPIAVVAGSVAGGIGALLLLAFGALFVLRYRRRRTFQHELRRDSAVALHGIGTVQSVSSDFEMMPSALFSDDSSAAAGRQGPQVYPTVPLPGQARDTDTLQLYDPRYYATFPKSDAADTEPDTLGTQRALVRKYSPFVEDEAAKQSEEPPAAEREPGDDYTEYQQSIVEASGQPVYEIVRRERQALRQTLNGVRLEDAPPNLSCGSFERTPAQPIMYAPVYNAVRSALRKRIYIRPWLHMHEILGRGTMGVLLLASTTDGGTREAYKVTVVALKSDATEQEATDFLADALELAKFSHQNVMRLIGVCAPEEPWMTIIEHAQYGDLRGFLRLCVRTPTLRMTLAEQCDLAGHVAAGMEYLAARNVVHGKLAARTCIVCEGTVAKVAGFGVSLGTGASARWTALEALEQPAPSSPADVWSFGVLLWEIATFGTARPYDGVRTARIAELLRAGVRLHWPRDCADALYALMSRCWIENPQHRPTFAEINKSLQRIREGLPIRDVGGVLDALTWTEA